jgi:hypothetical protein
MYNIHSHYENILSYAKSIIAQPTLAYLHPFGSTQPENIELINIGGSGPLLFCYDQEPLLTNYDTIFLQAWASYDDYGNTKPAILLNTERVSAAKNQILKKFKLLDCHYFFHAFAAADWYRGYKYCHDLIPLTQRKINKKYISFNRLTGAARVYRSFLISELAKLNILNQGHVSYSHHCPEHGHYSKNIINSVKTYGVPNSYALDCIETLNTIKFPLLIDSDVNIPNGSQTLGPLSCLMESFLHVVTETCFWEEKTHLTEKIFKPIIAKQPFVLLGCADNLKYLQSYGFKTFDKWWDESYDSIYDPIQRLNAVVKIINDICSLSTSKLEIMLTEMNSVLEYNYNWFYSQDFIDFCWNELKINFRESIVQLEYQNLLKTQRLNHLFNLRNNKLAGLPLDI